MLQNCGYTKIYGYENQKPKNQKQQTREQKKNKQRKQVNYSINNQTMHVSIKCRLQFIIYKL